MARSLNPPANPNAQRIPITMVITDQPVENMPVAKPSMIVVAAPILAWSAIPLVGLNSAEV